MKFKFLLLLLVIGVFAFSYNASATMKVVNYTSQGGDITQAHFVVQTLKYEPYPVVPGQWVNVWVKAENVGEENAQDATFQLMPSYPFSSNESLTRNFGLIPGTVDAYKLEGIGDTSLEANQVVMKFRVKVSESAPEGENILKIKMSSGQNGNYSSVYDLPIYVEKSDVGFQSVMQSINPVATSFTFGNVGTNEADSITVTVNANEWNLQGDRGYVVGNLNGGDFSKFTVEGTPKSGEAEVALNISYTDVSGARRIVTQEVPVVSSSMKTQNSTEPSYLKWIFGIVGILIGIAIMVITRRIHNKRRK